MLRIIMISPLPPQRFGESRYTSQLIRGLASSRKMEITAIAGKDAEPLETKERNVNTLSVWKHSSLLYPISLVRHIKREKPHLVHVQFGPFGKLFGGLFGEVMLLLLVLLRLFGFRTTVTLHSTWMPEQVRERVQQYGILRKLSFLAPTMFRIYMRLLDWGTNSIQLSTVKEDSLLRRQFLREYRIDPDKVLEIPHPFDDVKEKVDVAEAKKRLDVANKRVILAFGFIRRGKGLDTAIRAMKTVQLSVSDSLLLIAGQAKDSDSQEYLRSLQHLCSESGLSNYVSFDNRYIPDEDVADYFSAASAILVPYAESVGASGPVHNFAAFGVPIVASDIGYHMKESLGGRIITFRTGDPNELGTKLTRVLTDTEYATRLGEEQRNYALHEGWDVAVARTLRNYHHTMNR